MLRLECRRRDVLALAAFLLFFFLYFNIHALHSDSSRELEGHISQKKEYSQRGSHGGQEEKTAGDPFASLGPANETLGVCHLVAQFFSIC